jgi:hypothetical protein
MSTPQPRRPRRTVENRSGLGAATLPGLVLVAASVLPSALSPTPPQPSVDTTDTVISVPATTTTTSTSRGKIFFGSLHSHSSYSDGMGTPADAFKRARDDGQMDFLALTEHNHKDADGSGPRKDGILIALQPALYNGTDAASLLSAARSFTVDDSFVAIPGQEFSTISAGNHANVFDVADIIDVENGNYRGLYDEWLPQHPDSLGQSPLVQYNHPDFKADQNPNTKPNQRENDYGFDDYEKDFGELRSHAEKFVSLIEIVSGPALTDGTNLPIKSHNRHEKDYWFYLNEGFRVAPTANQDNHFRNWGTITAARTAVLADRLTKADILQAMKARRVYATEDQNLQILFTVNGQPLGGIIRTQNPQDLTIQVQINDPDEPNALYKVELYRDDVGGDMIDDSIDESELEGDGVVNFEGQRFESGSSFFFVKVSQDGANGREEFAWTAPVWVEIGPPLEPTPPPTPTPGASPTPLATQNFVHSRNSNIYHFANCADVARIKPQNRLESATPPEDKTLHDRCPRPPQ